jgi:hypothetical protein
LAEIQGLLLEDDGIGDLFGGLRIRLQVCLSLGLLVQDQLPFAFFVVLFGLSRRCRAEICRGAGI